MSLRSWRLHHFLVGFAAGLVLFVIANLVAIEFLSDCGLAAAFGLARCADDIVRIGFPMIVSQFGGLVFRETFYPDALLVDLIAALALSLAFGFAARWFFAARRAVAGAPPHP